MSDLFTLSITLGTSKVSSFCLWHHMYVVSVFDQFKSLSLFATATHRSRVPELSCHYRSVIPSNHSSGGKSTDVEARVREVLAMVGLEHVADCVIGE